MTMKFYDALQMDPSVLKRMIASCDTKHHKAYYWTAMAVRSVLIVGFAIVFISLLSGIFGSDNPPLAVALFCMMLGIRFVNFEYCIRDSLAALAAVLAILVLAPSAAALLPPFFLIPLHFTAFFALLYMTTQRPEMGNGGLYSFAYIYLTGNPVFGVERFMWMGFACASLLSEYPYSGSTLVRFRHRIVGAVAGSFAFFVIYLATPEAFHPLMGPLGGIRLGFCTDYRYKTAMNCFGALMLGAGIYGLQGAVALRIMDTFLGVTFGLVFAAVFHRLAAAKFLSESERE